MKSCQTHLSFAKIGSVMSVVYLRRELMSTCTLHASRLIWMRFVTENCHTLSLSNHEFRENWYSGSHTLFKGTN
jgi:hypothetical protein